jgi:MATE family, multidrug efflux pump
MADPASQFAIPLPAVAHAPLPGAAGVPLPPVAGEALPAGAPIDGAGAASAPQTAPQIGPQIVTAGRSARTRQMLEGPIVPTLLRLALPNVVLMVVQAAMGALETYYVSGLGTEALAGVALAFPVLMLMQMMSAGAMGGGVSSAIARALGGERRADAQALVVHALLIAVGLGAAFTLAVVGGGPWLYAAMGGRDAALSAAVTYSAIVFLGAIPLWISNTLANVLRGTGNMFVPAAVSLAGALAPIALSPALIYGWGPLPRLGVAGAGVGLLTYYLLSAGTLAAYLASGRATLTLAWRGVRLRRGMFWEILRVGLLSSVGALMSNLVVILVTGIVGTFGTAALAGYGIGSRLEYMQIPLVFGFGAALVAMVGTNIGAGQAPRAERIAWIGASIAGGMTLGIGTLAALWPLGWAGLFSADPAVLAVATGYLRWVGPAYGFLGFGLALYFASQGAGRMGWPVTAGLLRLSVATLGGWLAVSWFGSGLDGVFALLALALALFGGLIALAIRAGAWRRGTHSAGAAGRP